jgi:hypothetical protein
MAKRHHHMEDHTGHYEGHHKRRMQEMKDAGMIHEDHSAIANLPQNVMIKPYPMVGAYMDEGLDDTIRGVDHQMDTLDGAKGRSHLMPKKV